MSGIFIDTRRDRHCHYLTGEKIKEKSDFLHVIQNRSNSWISRLLVLIYKEQCISEHNYS